MPSFAFTPPVASLPRSAAAAAAVAGVCERMALHEALVAKSSAAARIAWEAELTSLRTSSAARPSMPTPPPAMTHAAVVLAARVARIVGEPALLVREPPVMEKVEAMLDEKDIAARYHARMAKHGLEVAAVGVLAEKGEEHRSVGLPEGRVSKGVRFAAEPAKVARNFVGADGGVRKTDAWVPASATVAWAASAAVPAGATSSAAVAQTVRRMGAAEGEGVQQPRLFDAVMSVADTDEKTESPKPIVENVNVAKPAIAAAEVEGVQRPNLVDAVMRTVRKWMDGMQKGPGEKKDDAGPAAAPAAAVGAAQVMAVLFSLGKQ